jgi:nucleotide-binding universal stress UspA family protein
MLSLSTILFPTDLSTRAAQVFPLACSLARDHSARLVVLHVYPAPAVHGEVVARRQPDGFEKHLLDQLHALRPTGEGVHVEYRLEEGDDVDMILKVAEETGAGLIVMGTHGRGGLARVLIGSVAEHVLRRAKCPVLTLRVPGV